MSEPVKKIEHTPESYSPKVKPEILTMAQHAAFMSDTIADPFNGGEPPRTSNKISEYKKIEPWQNYFLCSAICSVGLKLGSEVEDFHYYANFTGDNFTYLYASEKGNPNNVQCDSGVTNYFFVPQVVKSAFAAFGYECIYLSNAQIKKDFRTVMNAIKAQIDRGVPVLAWGIGNVTFSMTDADGKRWDKFSTLPEGCLIGGYDKNDVLYINLYPGPERLPEGSLDEYGYSTITNGLDDTKGLFFVGKLIPKTDQKQVCKNTIESIPMFLTMNPAENESGRYSFGKTAFETWADTLEDDSYFDNKTDDKLNDICWNLHCSPYCCVCTSSAYGFFKETVEKYPDLMIAVKLLPLYKQMQDFRQEIWDFQGGFYPPMDKFRAHDFRVQIADILREMGRLCDEILAVFEEESK